ncbi:MAG: PspC domain-containing protein [Thermoleophilia bacterium]|nr:PspC domain-containing protein [Thermoleophilia bacterium]
MPDDSHQDTSPGDGEESVRRLTRSADDRVIAGVCGGLARYFKIDPLITRIAAVGLVFVGGVGIVLYLAAWLLVPDEAGSTPGQGGLATRSRFATIIGAALAVIAALIVVDRAFWFPDHVVGPILFVGLVGAAVWWVIRGRRLQGVGSAGARIAMVIAVALLSMVAIGAGFAIVGFGGGLAAAGLLLVVGLSIVAASFRGGARWLIAPALALACGVGIATASDVDLRGDYGERYEVPRTLVDLPDEYDMGAGSLRIDLRDVEFPAGERRLHVEMGLGEVVVVVPPDLCVVPDVQVGLGEIAILGRTQHGPDLHRTDTATGEGPRLLLDTEMGMGSVRVTTDPAELDRNHEDWNEAHDDSAAARRASAACLAGTGG